MQKRALHLLVLGKGSEKFTLLEASRKRPLVLLVNVDWKQVKALRREDGGVVGSGVCVTNVNCV